MEIYQPGTKTLGKAATIGAGPAGSQASVTLTNQGYDVTIYEKEAHPGGWLRNGIPQFRLPQLVLDAEIARIEKMGVTIKCNNEVGNTLTLEQLKAENRAVLVTVGLSGGSGLPLFEHSNVEIVIDFLQRVRQAQGDISIPQSVLITGGGDVAMDVANTLKALGCQAVACVTREELDEFPASGKEFASTRELGVSIIDGFTPVAVEGSKVTSKHVRLPGEPMMVADKITLAVGQYARLDVFVELEPQCNIIKTQNYQTRDPQVFAVDDVVEDGKTVVYAMKTGKEATEAIHHYLEGACSC